MGTKEVWSAEKQDWCCANKQLGCPPKTKTRRDETPKDETSKDKTPPKDEPPKDETPKDETPEDEMSKDETPNEAPKDETPENDTPENDTPEIETPKIETPEIETPKDETPQDETPKSDATGNNSKAGSCSCMGYNADGSTVPSGECGWASQQTPGNSCMQVASQAECVVVPAEVSAGIAPAAQFKLGGKCD